LAVTLELIIKKTRIAFLMTNMASSFCWMKFVALVILLNMTHSSPLRATGLQEQTSVLGLVALRVPANQTEILFKTEPGAAT